MKQLFFQLLKSICVEISTLKVNDCSLKSDNLWVKCYKGLKHSVKTLGGNSPLKDRWELLLVGNQCNCLVKRRGTVSLMDKHLTQLEYIRSVPLMKSLIPNDTLIPFLWCQFVLCLSLVSSPCYCTLHWLCGLCASVPDICSSNYVCLIMYPTYINWQKSPKLPPSTPTLPDPPPPPPPTERNQIPRIFGQTLSLYCMLYAIWMIAVL